MISSARSSGSPAFSSVASSRVTAISWSRVTFFGTNQERRSPAPGAVVVRLDPAEIVAKITSKQRELEVLEAQIRRQDFDLIPAVPSAMLGDIIKIELDLQLIEPEVGVTTGA